MFAKHYGRGFFRDFAPAKAELEEDKDRFRQT